MSTIQPQAAASAPLPRHLRILRSPAGRIAAFFVMLTLLGMLARQAYLALGLPREASIEQVTPLILLFRLAPIVLAYALLVRLIERRPMDAGAPPRATPPGRGPRGRLRPFFARGGGPLGHWRLFRRRRSS